MLYSRIAFCIHYKCNSVHPLTSNSQSVPPLPLPLGTTSLFSTSMTFFSVDDAHKALSSVPGLEAELKKTSPGWN